MTTYDQLAILAVLALTVGLQIANRHGLPPGQVLIPLAFGTILGGMTTLIGTPPSLVMSGCSEKAGARSFGMFEFSPVGLAASGAAPASDHLRCR